MRDVYIARAAAVELSPRHPGLCLLALFGSRARGGGEPRAGSDWDFGYLGDNVDADALLADLAPVASGPDHRRSRGVLVRPPEPGRSRQLRLRNVVAHAYESLDMARVHRAATSGPADLRAFLAAIAERV